MSALKLWTNGADTYVARDVEHVLELYKQAQGVEYDADDCGEWELREDEGPFAITDEDGGKVTRTPAEWIAENGPGFLCSTEF